MVDMNKLHFMGCRWALMCSISGVAGRHDWVAGGHEWVAFHGLQVDMNKCILWWQVYIKVLHFIGCKWA